MHILAAELYDNYKELQSLAGELAALRPGGGVQAEHRLGSRGVSSLPEPKPPPWLSTLAERYQLSGGETMGRGWRAEFSGMQAQASEGPPLSQLHPRRRCRAPSLACLRGAAHLCAQPRNTTTHDGEQVDKALRDLHADSEGEERSVQWPDERGGGDGEGGSDSEELEDDEWLALGADAGGGGRDGSGRERRQQQQQQSTPASQHTPSDGGGSGSRPTVLSPSGLRQIDIRRFFGS